MTTLAPAVDPMIGRERMDLMVATATFANGHVCHLALPYPWTSARRRALRRLGSSYTEGGRLAGGRMTGNPCVAVAYRMERAAA